MLFLGSLLAQTSSILHNTILMKAGFVSTVLVIALPGNADNGFDLKAS